MESIFLLLINQSLSSKQNGIQTKEAMCSNSCCSIKNWTILLRMKSEKGLLTIPYLGVGSRNQQKNDGLGGFGGK